MSARGNPTRRLLMRLAGALVMLCTPLTSLAAQEVYGPKDEQATGGWDGQVSVSATYAKRARELISDFDRSGAGTNAMIGYEMPSGGTTLRIEGRFEADKYATTFGGEAEVRQKLGENLSASVSVSGTKHAVVLESLDADQAAVRGGLTYQAGNTKIEAYGRHRWRRYHDASGGTSEGWQVGGKVRQRFGSYHWLELGASHERIADNGGTHGYRRTSLAIDYSQPVAKRLRVVMGADYRAWTYTGRHIGDVITAPQRHDRLIRPEVGLSYGKTKGAYVQATAAYDFYRSNDARYSGNGPRLRLTLGYRF